jgi:hypothetical protein
MEPDHIPEDLLDEYALALIFDLVAALREVQLMNN